MFDFLNNEAFENGQVDQESPIKVFDLSDGDDNQVSIH